MSETTSESTHRVPGITSDRIAKIVEKGLASPHSLDPRETKLLCGSVQKLLEKRKEKKAAKPAAP